jgi:hypothetical protein
MDVVGIVIRSGSDPAADLDAAVLAHQQPWTAERFDCAKARGERERNEA